MSSYDLYYELQVASALAAIRSSSETDFHHSTSLRRHVSPPQRLLPLYRRAQPFAGQGIALDRPTLCNWVCQAC